MTAVEWLNQNLVTKGILFEYELFEQAKQMEKEQIMNAVNFGDERGKITTYLTAEQYYNETYKNNNQ